MHGRNTYYIQTINCWVLPPYLSAHHLQGQLLSCSLRMQTLGLRFQIVPRIDQVQKDERKSKPQIRKQPNSQIVALGCSVYNRRVASDS